MQSDIYDESQYAKSLYEKGYLPGPIQCTCGSKIFTIYTDNQYKTTLCSFRCLNSKCRLKYPIRINSFFQKFNHKSLKVISEVLNCFLVRELNASKTVSFLKEEFNVDITIETIYSIFKEIREVIYQYMDKMYQTEKLGLKDEHELYSMDESLIGHRNGKQLWLLGIIKNTSKEFRIEASFLRDTPTIKKFINKFVDKGNTIVTDGWNAYNYLDNAHSGYIHIKHLHNAGSFGMGLQSTSHIESIWAQIKSKIKETYHSIPNRFIIRYVKEAEYKIINKKKSKEEKIKEFFDIYRFLQNVSDAIFENNEFYRDSDDSDSEIEEEDSA